MAKARGGDPFDPESVRELLDAAGIDPGAAAARPFLAGLRAAVKWYRLWFPRGRPEPKREVRLRRDLVDQSVWSGEKGARMDAWLVYCYAVVRAERRTLAEVLRLCSGLRSQLTALSRDGGEVLV